MTLPYRGSGAIYYKNKEYRCDIFYNDDKGGIIIVIKDDTNDGTGKFIKFPFDFKFLYGKLESGFLFCLYNLKRTELLEHVPNGVTEYKYYAEYLFSGIDGKNEDEPTIPKMSFVLSDIVKWGGESAYIIEDGKLSKRDGAFL